MNNPLLDFTDLPLFVPDRPEHVRLRLTLCLAAAEVALQTVTEPGFSD